MSCGERHARAPRSGGGAVSAKWPLAMVALLLVACAKESVPPVSGDLPDAAGAWEGAASPVDGSGGIDARADFQAMIASYGSWSSPTSEPIAVSSHIFALCRGPTPFEQAFSVSEHGHHRLIREWDNESAWASMVDADTGPFLPGAAIVKEKLVPRDGGLAVVALGLMIKRQPGFDPAHGDWDFAYWEQEAGLESGPAQSAHCGDCHAAARGTDFVFAHSLAPGR